jgi:hypothetical protein
MISYASRTLRKYEENYPAMKLESLYLKWAVTETFYNYLYGLKFTVKTDNSPLTYMLSSAKLDTTGQRCVSALSAFGFNIIYKPGRMNTDADALSRYPTFSISISSGTVQTVYSSVQVKQGIVDMAETGEPFDIIEAQSFQDNHWHNKSLENSREVREKIHLLDSG